MHADDPALDLMDRITAALNSHDLDAVLALAAEDIVLTKTGVGRTTRHRAATASDPIGPADRVSPPNDGTCPVRAS